MDTNLQKTAGIDSTCDATSTEQKPVFALAKVLHVSTKKREVLLAHLSQLRQRTTAGARPLNSRWARARGGRTWRPSFTPSTSSTSRTTGSTVCARPPPRSTQPSRREGGDRTAENAGETAREGRHLHFLQQTSRCDAYLCVL